MSILESGKIQRDEEVDLNHICRDVISELIPFALEDKKNIEFSSAIANSRYRANKMFFSQAIRNLIENALRYTPSNGVVEVFLKEGPTIEVCDRGPGIPVELRERLFHPFVQGADRKGNAGLGLSIVAETLRLHGGEIIAEDRLGGGTTFRMKLY